MNNADKDIDVRAWWALWVVIVVGFVVWTYGELRDATAPSWQDTTGYLAHALYIAEHGGFPGFLREAFTGVFPFAERHPLYMLMIAPFAARTAEFFWIAKIVNLVTGIVVLLSLIWMVNRRYGRGPALVAGLLFALTSSLVVASSHVNNENQLTLCMLWAWWFLTDSGKEDAEQQLSMPVSIASWAMAGAWLGLAYLAKTSAILLAMAVIVAGLWYTRLKFLTTPRLWAFLAAATLLASPLLARNIVGFGTPFYESVNSRVVWMDDWNEMGGERSILYYDTYGEMIVERDGLPTAAEYFATHSISDILRRLAQGISNQFLKVIPEALGSPVLWFGGRIMAYVVFPLALAGWWLRRRSWDATLTFFWSGAFIALFSWNTIFPEPRYIAPLIPVWIAFAAFAAGRLGTLLLRPVWVWRLQIAASCALVALALGSTVAAGSLTQPRPIMQASPSYFRFIDWLNRNANSGDRIMIGATREFHGLIFMVEPRVQVLLNPDAKTLDRFLGYLRDRNARYLLMHSEYLSGKNREIARELEPYFDVRSDGTFDEEKSLPGWRPVYRDEEIPGRFIIYEPVGAASTP